jgi:hypothetical protein
MCLRFLFCNHPRDQVVDISALNCTYVHTHVKEQVSDFAFSVSVFFIGLLPRLCFLVNVRSFFQHPFFWLSLLFLYLYLSKEV